MSRSVEVIVVGLGAMGSAAVYQLAGRGVTVLGIDQFHPPHALGSSHGESRMIRQAVGEGAAYVPLVRRAYDLWRALEEESGRPLLHLTGGYIIGSREGGPHFHGRSDFVGHTAALAEQFAIDHRLCSAAEVRRQMPLVRIGDHETAYFEPTNGLLRPEPIIQAQLDLAAQRGAVLHFGERVGETRFDRDGVTVVTDRGSYRGERLILAAGPWMPAFMPRSAAGQLKVYRQLLYWFEVEDPALFAADRFPWLIWIGERSGDLLGVFPILPGGTPGVKVLTEQYDRTTGADTVDRQVRPAEIQAMFERFVAPRLDGVTDRCLKAEACLYTVTPDEHFLVDFHPDSDRVLLASPCSGHGFKHAAAIGEGLAQMVLGEPLTLDWRPFRFPENGGEAGRKNP